MNVEAVVKIKRYFSVWTGGSNAECPTQKPVGGSQRFDAQRSMLHAPRSSGIALVMVLGILSVMVIMAVAFAIAMRTERVAAGNYADGVRARQLVQVGLARALNNIQDKLCLPDRIVVDQSVQKIIVMGGGTWEVGDVVVFDTPGTFPLTSQYTIAYSTGAGVRLAGENLNDEGTLPDAIVPSENLSVDASGLKTSGMRLYYRGTPVSVGGNATYYVVPVDQTHIKLADSYANALRGKTLSVNAATLKLKPIHYMSLIHTITEIDDKVKTLALDRACKFKTGDAVTYHYPPSPTNGLVYFVRAVESNKIQVVDSFNKAVSGKPEVVVDVKVFKTGGYLKKHGFLAPPWAGWFSSTTNASPSIVVKPDLVTIVGNQLLVSGRYHSGDCVTFPAPPAASSLKSQTPYYVISDGTDMIKLATSIDNALASTPMPLGAAGNAGAFGMYLTMLTGEATNCIPMSLYANVATAACVAVTNMYLDITSDGVVFGKYRYLVADCSSLLDANFIGGSGDRRFGINAQEIAIENLPELNNRWQTFLTNRRRNSRYETVQELAALDARPDNLSVYSYCPPEKWNTDMLNYFAPVNLAGGVVALGNRKPAIINAFRMAGIKEPDYQERLFRSLIDYVDGDNIPNNYGVVPASASLALPSNEKIPMINEIKFDHALTATYDASAPPIIKRKYTYTGKITFEIWWPFVDRPPNGGFTFDYDVGCVATISAIPVGSVQLTDFSPQIWSGAPASGNNLALDFSVQGPFVKIEIPCLVSGTPSLDNKKIDNLQLNFAITAQIKSVTDAGALVDEITYAPSFRLSPIDEEASVTVEDHRDMECLDPRYNHDIGNNKYWRCVAQSFVNSASSEELTLSDYSAGRSFGQGDFVAILPSLSPGDVKIYQIASENNGKITINIPGEVPTKFADRGDGGHYIKAVLDRADPIAPNNTQFKLKTARVYQGGDKVRLSDGNTATVQSYDPKTRIIVLNGLMTATSAEKYIRDRDMGDLDSDSLGTVNYWTLSYLDGETHSGDPYMCVENTNLQSVVELGRLIYSVEPWQNPSFYNWNTNQLLDVFAVGNDNGAAGFVTIAKRGVFNPNAGNTDCLATVLSGALVDDFNDATPGNEYHQAGRTFTLKDQVGSPLDRYYFSGMPITLNNELYYVHYADHNDFTLHKSFANAISNNLPEDALGSTPLTPAKMTMDMARIMAQKMTGKSCATYSQLARTLSDFDFGSDDDAFPYPATDLEKASLLGHSIGLLGLGQNLFTIIIEAQVASGGNISSHPVKQRAVALVWRDPYTGEMFVRSIKWLRD